VYDPLGFVDPAPPATALQGISPTSLVEVAGGSNARISPRGFDDMRIIGEAQQQWAPLRRKYDLFLFHLPQLETDTGSNSMPSPNADLSRTQQAQLSHTSHDARVGGEYHQFASVDEPFLSWDFCLRTADHRLIGSVNRNFAGFAREIFTDTGVYALRMDSAALMEAKEQRHLITHGGESPVAYPKDIPGMTLDQRAVMLAAAVSIDFDYFSRHSSAGGMPIWGPGAGGEATAGGVDGAMVAGVESANQVTATGEAAAIGEPGAGALGMAESAVAEDVGAGALAGHEAMRRGMQSNLDFPVPPPQAQPGVRNETWGQDQNPWWRDGQVTGGEGVGFHGDEDGDSDWF
jgi:Scramblase